ncbi:hypothetical protein BDZ91DRAFT_718797 [Kalaharituber pfeilii]|nr:hypothetical protein BDZ91DRAFT_718797 [Kalaharituber pfeilii]
MRLSIRQRTGREGGWICQISSRIRMSLALRQSRRRLWKLGLRMMCGGCHRSRMGKC